MERYVVAYYELDDELWFHKIFVVNTFGLMISTLQRIQNDPSTKLVSVVVN